MPNSIVLPKDYTTTYEDCPICQEPHMRIRHGYTDGHPDYFLHLEYCENEECENHEEPICIVGYECPTCMQQYQRQSEGTPV